MTQRNARRRNPYKPGPGWQRTADPSVWHHVSGLRVSTYGLILLPSGRYLVPQDNPRYRHGLWQYHRVNGDRGPQHSNHRAILAWALWVASQEEPQVTSQERMQ
jgi:hypothetical protein